MFCNIPVEVTLFTSKESSKLSNVWEKSSHFFNMFHLRHQGHPDAVVDGEEGVGRRV